MACQVALYVNVSASAIEADSLPYDDQEYIQCFEGYLKFSRMCFFMVEHGNHWRYVENLLSLKHRLCRHGSHLVVNGDTGCRLSLDPLQVEDIIRTIAVRVERMVMQNSHREKIPFVVSCDVIMPRYGQTWEKEARMGSADFSDFGVVPTTNAAIDLIEKRKRDESFKQ